MSDTSTTEPPRSGRQGHWTPEDIAKLLPIPEELIAKKSGVQMSRDQAMEALLKRIGGKSSGAIRFEPVDGFTQDLVELIARGLPDEALDTGVIEKMDLRPYLQAIIDNPEMKMVAYRPGLPDDKYRAPETAKRYLEAIQTGAEANVRDALKNEGLTPDEMDAAIADIKAFDPGTVGTEPMTNIADRVAGRSMAKDAGITVDASSAMAPEWNPTTLAEQQTAKQGFPEAEFRLLLSTGEADLSGLMQEEARRVGNGEASGYMPVDVGQEGYFGGGKPGTQKLSILDSLGYLQKLPPSQVKIMQQQMANAGYFQAIGAQTGYVEGDALDPPTMAAWRQLLTDSISQNIPVPQLVATKAATFRSEQRAKYVDQLLDPVNKDDVSTQATDAVRQLLGRGVTADELNEITSYLDQLRNDRASFITGAQGNEADRGIQAGDRQGYDENDINAKIMKMYGGEADTQNSFDQWQKITKAFGVEVPDPALTTKD